MSLGKTLTLAICIAATCLCTTLSSAADKADVREKWHTPFNLYLDPVEAYRVKSDTPEKVVFIDIRTRAEIQYVGFSDVVDANIPLFLFDQNQWKPKIGRSNGRYRQVYNDHFVDAVDRLIASKGLDKHAAVILMCQSGSRSPLAAQHLHEAGYTKVYTQHEGFEGVKAKSGPFKGKRQVNGWKNRGLPWSYQLPTNRMYFNFASPAE